jgi:uncharacterized membrane protein YoaK (UPF0700 family)
VIFGNPSISTYSKSNMTIWMMLALQAGLLNMGGLMACHTYVSHVTGFASLFGLEIRAGSTLHAIGLLSMPVAFLLGGMLSGLLVDLRLKMNQRPNYYIVFAVLFLLTLAITVGGFNGVFGEFGRPLSNLQGYLLVWLLCFTCGMQNGTITLVSKSIVRTTHLTGITTDLAIGLIRVINRKRIEGLQDEGKANVMRVGIIGFFILGSYLGATIFSRWQFRGFMVPCAISLLLLFMTSYFQLIRPRIYGRS